MKVTSPLPAKKAANIISASLMRVQTGTHHDPFEVLGTHAQPDGSLVLRAFLPAAEAVEVADTRMSRVPGTDCLNPIPLVLDGGFASIRGTTQGATHGAIPVQRSPAARNSA